MVPIDKNVHHCRLTKRASRPLTLNDFGGHLKVTTRSYTNLTLNGLAGLFQGHESKNAGSYRLNGCLNVRLDL